MIREILLLGNPALYERSAPVAREELPEMARAAADLEDTLLDYRAGHGAGRAIAAPQVGLRKRLIQMDIGTPETLVNPRLRFPDEERMEVLDDCMSFPGLRVRVLRHRRCVVTYRDLEWRERELALEGDLAELIQHEYDHLDGVLATMRAVDGRAFYLEDTLRFYRPPAP